jgi:hypothetical protein
MNKAQNLSVLVRFGRGVSSLSLSESIFITGWVLATADGTSVVCGMFLDSIFMPGITAKIIVVVVIPVLSMMVVMEVGPVVAMVVLPWVSPL